VIGPEQGLTQPGMTICCGDSHTSTHGAFGAIAFGIGTSQVRDVLATQCLAMDKQKVRRIEVNGTLRPGVYAKDVILDVIGRLGVNGGVGYAYEYAGDTIARLSMEERMTVCNMVIEAGGKNGIIAADATTREYLRARTTRPYTEVTNAPGAVFVQDRRYDARRLEPVVAKPHSPDNRALARELGEVRLTRAYIGSCTGGKITDFVNAARVLKGRRVAVDTFLVPSTTEVSTGLRTHTIDGRSLLDIFRDAGCQISIEASCAACLGGPKDTFGRINGPEVCISTTNRNFPGRMGAKEGQVYLASPYTVAASAVTGRITDPREMLQ
jgi:3-isopropylmalate/(R)-2-methylmalate dehydratase large subunit